MTRRELMALYGISESVIRRLGLKRLNAMDEDARLLLVGMSKRHAEKLHNPKPAVKRAVKKRRVPQVHRMIELSEKLRVA